MLQEKAIVRLINCLAGSLILHAFILLFSQQTFWSPVGSSRNIGHSGWQEPLTVRLVPKELPAAPITKISSAPTTPTPTSATSTFHGSKELSRMPEIIGQPPEAIQIGQGTTGEVVFKLSINRFGKVTLLQQLKSTLPRETEGKLAMQLYLAKYRAGEINGIAVDSEMIVDLRLDSGGWLTDKLPVLRSGKPQENP
jgi:hypothetical protein